MGRLSLASSACVGSSVVSWAGSQATWVLVPAQPAPNPLSDSLPIPMLSVSLPINYKVGASALVVYSHSDCRCVQCSEATIS